MSPHRRTAACWASGGEVIARHGPIAPVRAVELAHFFRHEALCAERRCDHDAARFLALTALDYESAVENAGRWRRAGGLLASHAI